MASNLSKSLRRSFFLIALISGLFLNLNSDAQSLTNWLWKQADQVKNLNQKTRLLAELGRQFRKIEDQNRADSAYKLALQAAIQSSNDTLQQFVYYSYLENGGFQNAELGNDFANRLLGLANKLNNDGWRCEACLGSAWVAIVDGRINDATDLANKALALATEHKEDPLAIRAMTALGQCYEQSGKLTEAFDWYMKALSKAEMEDDAAGRLLVYTALAQFYDRSVNDPAKAKEYFGHSIAAYRRLPLQDSTELMDLYKELAKEQLFSQEEEQGKILLRNIISYAQRHREAHLLDNSFVVYRSFLLDSNRYSELEALYSTDYPDQLSKIQKEDTLLYLRLKAIFTMNHNQPDSCVFYYRLASKYVAPKDAAWRSNFYRRYGQALLANGEDREALKMLDSSYLLAKAVNYLPFIIEATGIIDSIYRRLNNYQVAYEYAKINAHYRDEQAGSDTKARLVRMEIGAEQERIEIRKEQEERETEHRHKIQYYLIMLLIAVVFIALGVISSVRVPGIIIRGLNFLSFIFLFEFIILLLDHQIIRFTAGEPWKMLAIKVVVIAGLLPLHHWLEHKVIQFLFAHRFKSNGRLSLLKLIPFRKPQPVKSIHKKAFKPRRHKAAKRHAVAALPNKK